MRYAQIREMDVANGPGIRSTIFVTGCTHKCPECFNEEYQNFQYGNEWTDKETETIINYLKSEYIEGLTLLGGEPMQNLGLIPIVKEIKEEVDKSIWIYSGYTYEQILKDPKKLELLELCDVLVDGLYVDALRDLNLKFRGSSNQRIIDIKRSLQNGQVIFLDLDENK